MLTLNGDASCGTALPDFAYIEGRGRLGRQVLRLTRWLRAVNANRYIGPAERHLDIGCGDGYFLRRSPCRERYGLDLRLGDDPARDGLDFPDGHFDFVTALAVIEHIAEPKLLISEVTRCLKPGGCFILTTPKRTAEYLIALYAKDIGEEHERYYGVDDIVALAGDALELTGHHTFLAGLNQTFCLTRRA